MQQAKRGGRSDTLRPSRQYLTAVALTGLIALILATAAYKNEIFPVQQVVANFKLSKSDRFNQTRTGEIMITSDDGKCRRLWFNNETGTFSSDEKDGECAYGFFDRPYLGPNGRPPPSPLAKTFKNVFSR